ncbi:glucose-6-phosphate isomerase [Candidatus Gracilibacteria bacterium]|nr:glucose-6-phosphate isomerase [Candidatus Gracilibacteria bacterium]
MISLNLQNLFALPSAHGVQEAEWYEYGKKLPLFLQKVKNRKQGFYEILDEEDVIQNIEKFGASIKGKYSDIVVLGIGGSALGTIALRDALTQYISPRAPRLQVLDNIDPEAVEQIALSLALEKTLFLVVTKSGETPETVAQYFFFRQKVEAEGLDIRNHFVCITGSKGFLRQEVEKENLTSFPVPENVGGRFSVLTSVGLVPACLIGIDIRALLSGAREIRDQFLSEDFKINIPFQLAVAQFLVAQKGKTQHVFMPYTNALRSFANWFAQLLAESTGKINMSQKNVGLTPLPSIGVTDQHSLLQLFVQGPNDKLIIFVAVETWSTDALIPVPEDTSSWKFLRDTSFGTLLQAEQKATADSLTEEARPNMTLSLPSISPETLGALFFLLEGAKAFLGEFLEINAFNQPGVERSKILTREYLSRKK